MTPFAEAANAAVSRPTRYSGPPNRRDVQADCDGAVVFVVDRDATARRSLTTVIEAQGLRCESFAAAADFLRRRVSGAPSCLIADIDPPRMNGLELQAHIAMAQAETPVIFMAQRADAATAVKAMKAGALEFFTEPVDDQALVDAIRTALERSANANRLTAEVRVLRERYATLTHREREVMDLIVAGRMNKQIAFELSIREVTVKVHRCRVMAKMHARSLAELVRFSIGLASNSGRAAAA
jgi:FixJ family two-component response regulator